MGARRFLLAALLLAPLVQAAEPLPPGEKPLPDEIKVIRYQAGEQTIEETRIRGVLQSTRVIPKHGAPYELVPADGSSTASNDKPTLYVPSWRLFSW